MGLLFSMSNKLSKSEFDLDSTLDSKSQSTNSIACQITQLDIDTLIDLINKFDKIYIYCNGEYYSDEYFYRLLKSSVNVHGGKKVFNTIEFRAVWNNYNRQHSESVIKIINNIEAAKEYNNYIGNKL